MALCPICNSKSEIELVSYEDETTGYLGKCRVCGFVNCDVTFIDEIAARNINRNLASCIFRQLYNENRHNKIKIVKAQDLLDLFKIPQTPMDKINRILNKEYYCDWVNIESNIFQEFINKWKGTSYQVENMKLLYKNMISLTEKLSIARETGKFEIKDANEIKKNKIVIKKIEELEIEIGKLRKMLKQETRFSERLALNKKIKFINNYITNLTFPRK